MTTKVLNVVALDRTDKRKRKSKQEMTVSGCCEAFIYPGSLLTQSQKKSKKDTNYHNYSTPAPSGEPMTTKGGMYDASESEARCAWVQRVST
jgi:hypothetical protein